MFGVPIGNAPGGSEVGGEGGRDVAGGVVRVEQVVQPVVGALLALELFLADEAQPTVLVLSDAEALLGVDVGKHNKLLAHDGDLERVLREQLRELGDHQCHVFRVGR